MMASLSEEEKRTRIARSREEAIRRKRLFEESRQQSAPSTPVADQKKISTQSPQWTTTPSSSFNAPGTGTSPLPRFKTTVTAKLLPCGSGSARIGLIFAFNDKIIAADVSSYFRAASDPSTRVWSVAMNDYREAERRITTIDGIDVTFVGLHDNVTRLFRGELNGQSPVKAITPSDLEAKIEASILDRLFPFQRNGVIFGIQRNGRVLIADDMGLGKSVQALGVARYYKDEWPLVIVCPSSVKFTWRSQIDKFLPVVRKDAIFVIDKGSDPLPSVSTSDTVVIVSYNQMVTRQKDLVVKNYRVIIFDESHSIKDRQAKRTKTALNLAKRAHRVVLLSGTPALSRPAELFNQVQAIDPKLFPNWFDFANRYCDGQQTPFGFQAKGANHTDELAAILEKTVMIRRMKRDVLDELPPKRREKVILSSESIKYRLKELQRVKQACISSAGKHEVLVEFYAETGLAKAKPVADYICSEFFNDECEKRKLLIFAHHQMVMDTIVTELAKRKIELIRIDGSTPSKRRDELCERFQTDEKVSAAVLSVTAAGVGITLTAASVVVFAELHWNPGTLMQAEDRAHRVGQKDSVFVQYIVAENTADDIIWSMVQKKLDVLTSINLSNEKDNFSTAKSRTSMSAVPDGEEDQKLLTDFFSKLPIEEATDDFPDDFHIDVSVSSKLRDAQPAAKRAKPNVL